MVAVERAGVPLSRVSLRARDPLREELTDQTRLPWLGEVVPLALPLRPAVASPGDVLLAAGGALFIFTGLTGFGRSVPDRVLTPVERRKNRRSRKAARPPGGGRDRRTRRDRLRRQRHARASGGRQPRRGVHGRGSPAVLGDSFGDPVSVDAVSAASASPARPPARPQTSNKPPTSKKGERQAQCEPNGCQPARSRGGRGGCRAQEDQASTEEVEEAGTQATTRGCRGAVRERARPGRGRGPGRRSGQRPARSDVDRASART